MNKKTIAFYYPSMNIGGAQLLFLRVADELSKCADLEVYVLDYKDGYLSTHCSSRVNAMTFDEFVKLKLKNATIIAPLSMLKEDFGIEQQGVKILYWGIHPENLVDIFRGASRLRGKIPFFDFTIKAINLVNWFKLRWKLLKEMKANHIFFMDEPNMKRTHKFFNLNTTAQSYLPVPITHKVSGGLEYQQNFKNVLWIGRLSKDKIHSLVYSILSLEKTCDDEIVFHVIGDGEESGILAGLDLKFVTVKLYGSLPNSELDKFFIENKIGLVFAMGTSALEAAIRRVPTILVDPSFSPISMTYNATWLFNRKNYNLGDFSLNSGNTPVPKLYTSLKFESEKIGSACYEYTKINHQLDSVCRKIKENV